MQQQQLITILKQDDNLLPQDVLRNTDIKELVNDLVIIFETRKAELSEDARFKNNFTELVNYIYLMHLQTEPKHRSKKIFKDNLIAFLLNSPQPAV